MLGDDKDINSDDLESLDEQNRRIAFVFWSFKLGLVTYESFDLLAYYELSLDNYSLFAYEAYLWLELMKLSILFMLLNISMIFFIVLMDLTIQNELQFTIYKLAC